MRNPLSDLLDTQGILLADGATGSNLFARGLQTGEPPELWNDTHAEKISAQYQSFIDAGSDIILTNTFGGTRYRLNLHNAPSAASNTKSPADNRVRELNFKGAQIARDRADCADRKIIVGGSIGPTGEILAPLGAVSQNAAADAFEEQASALAEGGVDVLWVETMSCVEEAAAALKGTARIGLPSVVTFSVDTNGRTMMGLTPADIVNLTMSMENKPFAIGANCGVGASDLVAAIINMQHELDRQEMSTILIAKANCGIPQYIDGNIVYSGTQAIMSDYVRLCMDAGASIIGGCCGTTAEHIRAMRSALDQHSKQDSPDLTAIELQLGEISAGARAQLKGDLSIAGGALRPSSPRQRNRRSRKRG